MAVKSKSLMGKEFKSRAPFKKTRQGSSVRSKPRAGKKKYRGQGR